MAIALHLEVSIDHILSVLSSTPFAFYLKNPSGLTLLHETGFMDINFENKCATQLLGVFNVCTGLQNLKKRVYWLAIGSKGSGL